MIQNPNVQVRNFFNKEGVVWDGLVETAQNYTYEGEFQYIDVDYIPYSAGGTILIKDKGDNYGSTDAKLVTIMDRDSGRVYPNGLILVNQSNRTYRLRIDSHNAQGVKITANTDLNGQLCINRSNVAESKNVVKACFTNLIDHALNAKSNLVIFTNGAPKRYLVLKVSCSEATPYEVLLIDKKSNSETYNKVYLQGKETYRDSIKANYAGERVFYADVSNISIGTIYLNASVAAKISNIDYIFTDDEAYAMNLVGRNLESKNVDIITNDGMIQASKIDLSKVSKKWYVLFLDFQSGVSKFSGNSLTLDMNTPKIKPYRYDMLSTQTYRFVFDNANAGLKSGFYFLDVTNAVNPNALIELKFTNYSSASVSDLLLRVTHIGQFDDISQFQQLNNLMAFESANFECRKIADVDIDYALDDYWVSTKNNVVTLNKSGDICTFDINALFNWRINGDQDKRVFLLHPCMTTNVDDLHTNMMLRVYDDNNGGKDCYKVCNIDTISDVLDAANWSDVKWWEKKDSARKIPVTNGELVDAHHRYDTTLPASCYNYDEVSQDGHHIAFQGDVDNSTILHFMCHGKSMTLWGLYNNTGKRIPAWATTDGGRNWVAIFDFVNFNAGADIDTSAFADYVSGLTLYKVAQVNPTSENKEPADKFSLSELTGWNITKGVTTKVVFSQPHGLTNNTIVAFTGNATAEWNQLTTDYLTGTGLGDNVYIAVPTSTTELTLKLYEGSYDTQLSCRHIHSINETKSGYIIGCGESYPNGWILFVQDDNPSTGAEHDAMLRDFNIVRLNSTADGLQRPCGLIMKEDSDDPTVIFNSDHARIGNLQWSITGRTSLPKSSSMGIWKGKLSDIDDISKFECICDVPEPGIWMFRYNGIILVYYQFGGMAVSLDDGETFTYYPYYYAYRRLTGVYQGKIILNHGYEFVVK